ncbi:LOW QUALITY PROTEIN: hypothetical protein CRUP_009105 [Coryphaenoides rupestris]|nr:LOW QUALITY PROTEIN: hypothetical protein CRUP_009105 [Coryphaenoides rupestris]
MVARLVGGHALEAGRVRDLSPGQHQPPAPRRHPQPLTLPDRLAILEPPAWTPQPAPEYNIDVIFDGLLPGDAGRHADVVPRVGDGCGGDLDRRPPLGDAHALPVLHGHPILQPGVAAGVGALGPRDLQVAAALHVLRLAAGQHRLALAVTAGTGTPRASHSSVTRVCRTAFTSVVTLLPLMDGGTGVGLGPWSLTIDTEVEVLDELASCVGDATLVAGLVPQTGALDPQQLTSAADLQPASLAAVQLYSPLSSGDTEESSSSVPSSRMETPGSLPAHGAQRQAAVGGGRVPRAVPGPDTLEGSAQPSRLSPSPPLGLGRTGTVSWTFLELKPAALVAVHTNSPVSRPEGELRRRLPSGVVLLLAPTTFSARQVYSPASSTRTLSMCRLPSRRTVTYWSERRWLHNHGLVGTPCWVPAGGSTQGRVTGCCSTTLSTPGLSASTGATAGRGHTSLSRISGGGIPEAEHAMMVVSPRPTRISPSATVTTGDSRASIHFAIQSTLQMLDKLPRVSIQPQNQSFVGGQEVRIRCWASGYPAPRLVWTHNGMFIMGSSRHRMSPDGTLVIRNSERKDGGVYGCLASNQAGTHTQTSTLSYIDLWVEDEAVYVCEAHNHFGTTQAQAKVTVTGLGHQRLGVTLGPARQGQVGADVRPHVGRRLREVSKTSFSSTLTSHIEGDPPGRRARRVAGHAGVFPGVRRLGARDGHGAAQGVHLHLGRLAHRLLSYGGGWEQKVRLKRTVLTTWQVSTAPAPGEVVTLAPADEDGKILEDGMPTCKRRKRKVPRKAANTSNMAPRHLREKHPQDHAKIVKSTVSVPEELVLPQAPPVPGEAHGVGDEAVHQAGDGSSPVVVPGGGGGHHHLRGI